ncbi:transglycosylase domain-containing protein [Microlunatus soli]|uniref:Membrane carboxypeptidase (Penicillin-binding protein) n=1 Tax=Microlunatus soli TaxID=630515 RepID=A0A1H1PYS2_9ACTN|nr:transglycosylase domain-containing protein [Microlunatus soli]SDS16348.1 Membrane carboxypeptidase (penicillin-binding protein) [Microlunatus soli]
MVHGLKRFVTVTGAGAMFLVVSVLCGLLVAALVIPFAAASGFGARAANSQLSRVPTNLTLPPQAQRSKVLDVHGDVLAYFYDENRIYVSLDKVAPVMRRALLSIEDHRFYEHGAFDLKGTLRAFVSNQAAGGTVQGGSSITQQYVKMVLVNEATLAGDEQAVKDAQATTYDRKITELRYAIALEKKLSKDQILERYLNLAYFGDGAYGVEAAARHYFNTSAAKLTLPQAAMLAGLVQSPDAYNPVQHRQAGLDRRNEVLDRMAALKEVTRSAADAAIKTGFHPTKVTQVRTGCVDTDYPFLCDYVRRSLLATPSLGDTKEEREKVIDRGGLTVRTAIDPKTQDMAQRSVSKMIGPKDPLISTMDMIQPGTGLIVAMAQSRPVMGDDAGKGETYFNYSVPQSMGGGQGFQAGSTFKAFTAAAALQDGIPIAKTYNAKKTMNFSGRHFDSCQRRTSVNGDWKVTNSTGVNGKMNLAKAAAWSVNTYFVQLELATGMCDVTRMASRLGAQSSVESAPINSYDDKPSFTLGTVEVSPMSMSEAYATLASGGIHCNPIIISKITTPAGKELAAPSADCKRVISPDVARGVSKVLSGVVSTGSATKARLADHRPQAGKTGTIDSNAAVWFAGYTPEVSGAAMIAVDNTRAPFNKTKPGYRSKGLKGYTVPSTGVYLSGSGGGDAGPGIWKPAVTEYLADKPKTSFGEPSDAIVHGKPVEMPDVAGLSSTVAIKKLQAAGLTVRRVTRPSTTVPRGKFVRFSPASGKIAQYGTVKAVYSSGKPPTKSPASIKSDTPKSSASAKPDR